MLDACDVSVDLFPRVRVLHAHSLADLGHVIVGAIQFRKSDGKLPHRLLKLRQHHLRRRQQALYILIPPVYPDPLDDSVFINIGLRALDVRHAIVDAGNA